MSNESSAVPSLTPEPEERSKPAASSEKAPGNRRGPGRLNQKQQRELSRAQQMVTTARKPEYGPELLKNKITPALVTELEDAVKAARRRSENAASATVSKEGETAAGTSARATLLKSLRRIQSAARNEFSESQPFRINTYLVGNDIASSRPALESNASSILHQAREDQLAGITEEFLEEVEGQLEAYVNAAAGQRSEEGEGMKERAVLEENLKWIRARRKKIQYAADTAWPWTDAASAKARVEFQLPARRPYCY
jgi:hypothetical protein